MCSGNICRSPMAEQLLRAGLNSYPGVSVGSAGTVGLVGEPMDARALDLATSFGVTDAATHVARELNEKQIREADVVFAMSREHRRAVVQLHPRASRYTFTIREFARIAAEITDADLTDAALLPGDDVAGRFAVAVDAAASLRGMVTPLQNADDDDVVDPYRRADEVYTLSGQQLVPAVQATLALFGRAATAV
ncbi:arsenate reductase/protein-tyrosine-phosphatase family protein [Mycetocola manganoxydans]|uniref:arsenate reductase/protein-tyrosine-phosphatase family protein n=1 Tax=Mycetocola manganoxydans TaxID=699879 RepID=UPI0027E4CC2E|nr:low molecular weight phosphatase family protein [Mycetocola manganoxydans]